MDDLVKMLNTANIRAAKLAEAVVVYYNADDIILFAPSAQSLQYLVTCELELKLLKTRRLMPVNLPACDFAPGTKALALT